MGSAHQNPRPLGEVGQQPGVGAADHGGHSPPYSLASIAANRSVEPARLSKSIQGELDWIVMKALDKDRNRRYETADSFAGSSLATGSVVSPSFAILTAHSSISACASNRFTRRLANILRFNRTFRIV